jgi:hypothetical protein
MPLQGKLLVTEKLIWSKPNQADIYGSQDL